MSGCSILLSVASAVSKTGSRLDWAVNIRPRLLSVESCCKREGLRNLASSSEDCWTMSSCAYAEGAVLLLLLLLLAWHGPLSEEDSSDPLPEDSAHCRSGRPDMLLCFRLSPNACPPAKGAISY
jgi:hypothetical protein